MEPNHNEGAAFIANLLEDDEHISHHGIKGMKWGIRKARDGKIKARSTMTIRDRKETDWVQNDQRLKSTRGILLSKGINSYADAYNKTYRKAARSIRVGIRRINSDPKYKKQDFKKASALRTEYYKDISKMMTEQLNSAAATRKGASPSKKLEIHFNVDVTKSSQASVTVRNRSSKDDRKQIRADAKESLKKLKHADDDNSFNIEFETDENGYIIGVKEAEAKHSDQTVSFITGLMDENGTEKLSHYGVLGMKWGVRKDRRLRTTSSTKSSSKKKKPASSVKSTISSMSDEELKRRITRIENELRLQKLLTPPPKEGRAFVKEIAKTAGKQVLTTAAVGIGTYALGKAAAKFASPDLAAAISKSAKKEKK